MAEVTLKGNKIHTNGNLPEVNAKVPDFKLVDQNLNDRGLKDFKSKKKMIYMVPSLDTSTCSISTKKFNEKIKNHPEILILVISADLPFAQARYCGAEGVKNIITLSTMRNKDFGKDYGILIQDGPIAGLLARSVLILNEQNQVIYSELVPEISQEPNYDKALQVLLKT